MFPNHAVILTAAGSSERFNIASTVKTKKEFIEFDGHAVLYHALKPFTLVENLKAVAVTYKAGTLEIAKKALEELTEIPGVEFFFVEGGKTRQESVFNALKTLHEHNDELNISLVSIHDGARPFVSQLTIENCLGYAKLFGGAVPGLAVHDSLVKVDEMGCISTAVDRKDVYRVQTPQTFNFETIYQAHLYANENKLCNFTDDTAVFSFAGHQTVVVKGDEANKKVTYPEDLGISLQESNEEAEITGCTGNCSTCHGSCIKEEQ